MATYSSPYGNPYGGAYGNPYGSLKIPVDPIQSKIDRLQQYGADATITPKKSVLETLLDLLSRPEAASASLVGGLFKGEDAGTIASNVGQSLTGSKKLTYTDLLKESGMADNFGTKALGFVLGTALDPTTYVGVGAATRFAKKLPGIKQGVGLLSKGITGAANLGKQSELLKPGIEFAEGLGKYGRKLFGAEKATSGVDNLNTLMRGGITGRQGVEVAELTKRYEPIFRSVYNLGKKEGDDIFNRAIERADLTGLTKKNKEIATGLMDFFEKTGLVKKQLKTVDNLVGAAAKVGKKVPGLPGAGWDVKEAMSYFPHIITDEYREMMLKQGKNPEELVNILSGLSKTGLGKKERNRTLAGIADMYNAQSRTLNGFNMFETDVKKVLQKYTYNYTKNKALMEVGAETLKLTDDAGNLLIKSLKKGADVPTGMVKLNGLPYSKGYYAAPEVAKEINKVKGVLSSSADFNKFVKAFDKGMGTWKKLVTQFSPTFTLNNALGAEFNLFIKDANATKQFGNAIAMAKGKSIGMLKPKVGKAMTSEAFDKLLKKGGAFTSMVSPEKSLKKGITSTFDNFTGALNTGVEGIVRRQTALAEFLKTGDINKAIKAVWEVHGNYNPEALGSFERTVGKRVIPFLNWAKTNIPFQIKSLYQKTGKYAALARVQNEAVSLEERAQLPDWLRSSPLIPGKKNEDGTKSYFSANLPIGDLNDVTDWKKLIGNRLSPALKVPIELMANKNLYYNRPIVDETLPPEMQKANAPMPALLSKLPPFAKNAIGYNEYDKTSEATGKVTKKQEINAKVAYIMGQLGPLNRFGNIPKIAEDSRVSAGLDKNNINSIMAAITGLVSPVKANRFDPVEQQFSNDKQKQAELQARINYLIQRGIIPKLK